MVSVVSCAQAPLDQTYDANGICALDFESQNCWIEKPKNFGFAFGELKLQNERCEAGPPDYCWFAINHVELSKLLRARNRLREIEGD